MRKYNQSFEDLVQANKEQLLKDSKAIQEIEKRIEERKSKEFAKLYRAEKN